MRSLKCDLCFGEGAVLCALLWVFAGCRGVLYLLAFTLSAAVLGWGERQFSGYWSMERGGLTDIAVQ